MKTNLSPLDQAALSLAFEKVLHGPDKLRSQQVAQMKREDGWEYAATFAARRLQVAALGLRPWELAPCEVEPGGSDPASRLLDKMIAGGFSRFHHDPTEVLAGSRWEAVG